MCFPLFSPCQEAQPAAGRAGVLASNISVCASFGPRCRNARARALGSRGSIIVPSPANTLAPSKHSAAPGGGQKDMRAGCRTKREGLRPVIQLTTRIAWRRCLQTPSRSRLYCRRRLHTAPAPLSGAASRAKAGILAKVANVRALGDCSNLRTAHFLLLIRISLAVVSGSRERQLPGTGSAAAVAARCAIGAKNSEWSLAPSLTVIPEMPRALSGIVANAGACRDPG